MPRFKQQAQFDRGVTANGDFRGEFLVKNWPYQTFNTTTNNAGLALVWDDTNKIWFNFGSDGTNCPIATSANGTTWNTFTSISNFVSRVMSATKVPNSNFIFVGGNPAGSSANKIYYSTDVGNTWNVPSGGVGAADSENIEATAYGPTVGYLAMGSASGHIYHSSSGSSGWSLAFTAGGSPSVMFKGLAVGWNLGSLVAIAMFSGQSTYYSSTNGTSWISRTFPTSDPTSMTYNANRKAFYVATASGAVYSSVSGVGGWTLISSNASITIIRSFGNLLIGQGHLNLASSSAASGILYSADAGVTWQLVHALNSSNHIFAVAQQYSSLFPGGSGEPIYEAHQAILSNGFPVTNYVASLKGV